MDVVVVGAGISGLACAVRLREAGCSVEVVAAAPPGQTTSAVAAALWYPYRAFPEREVTRWGAATYAVLAEMAGVAGTGVRMRTGREIFNVATPEPWWRSAVPTLDRVPAADLPPGYVDGFLLEVPVVDSSVHLPWLHQRAIDLGVRFRWEQVTDLAAVAPEAGTIVNCTGLGAAALLDDDNMAPIRGQIVLVEQIGLTEWLLADTDPVISTYVVPREHTIVLGGTAEIGATDLEPDLATAEGIHARCVALLPELSRARVLADRVGLRPARSVVRLEADRLTSEQPVVHNYGHGGAGWTLSYGCAAEVTELVLSEGAPPVIASLAAALIVAALVLAAVCVLLVVINRQTSGLVLVGVAALEVALIAQSVIGFVLLARTDRPVDALTFVGYLVVILLSLPIATAWAVTERSRWGPGVLAAGCLVVPVLILRLQDLWSVAGA